MAYPANRIAEIRKQKKLSQQQLADMVGAHWVTISNLERGKSILTSEWLQKISNALQVDIATLAPGEAPTRVYISGFIARQKDLVRIGPAEDAIPVDATIGFDTSSSVDWTLVADNTLYPLFRAGDLFRTKLVLPEDFHHCFGRLVMITVRGPTPGKGRGENHVGYLSHGPKEKPFTLLRPSGSPLSFGETVIIQIIDRALYGPELPDLAKGIVENAEFTMSAIDSSLNNS